MKSAFLVLRFIAVIVLSLVISCANNDSVYERRITSIREHVTRYSPTWYLISLSVPYYPTQEARILGEPYSATQFHRYKAWLLLVFDTSADFWIVDARRETDEQRSDNCKPLTVYDVRNDRFSSLTDTSSVVIDSILNRSSLPFYRYGTTNHINLATFQKECPGCHALFLATRRPDKSLAVFQKELFTGTHCVPQWTEMETTLSFESIHDSFVCDRTHVYLETDCFSHVQQLLKAIHEAQMIHAAKSLSHLLPEETADRFSIFLDDVFPNLFPNRQKHSKP